MTDIKHEMNDNFTIMMELTWKQNNRFYVIEWKTKVGKRFLINISQNYIFVHLGL